MPSEKNKKAMKAAMKAAEGEVSNVGKETLMPHRDRTPSRISERRKSAIAATNGIQEIDPNLVLPWGPRDRLNIELTAVNSQDGTAENAFDDNVVELATSIQVSGEQHVPVLLRPSDEREGYYDVVYGRRRILACRYLGISVKALVRKLDDKAALQAKGLENSSRLDLSFYERARFAKEIAEQGYSKEETYTALNVSKNVLSQLDRVTRNVPDDLGDKIGPAPESGRPKWTALANALEEGKITVDQAHATIDRLGIDTPSDTKLAQLLAGLRSEPEVTKPVKGVSIKITPSGLSITVDAKEDPEFTNWIKHNIDSLIEESRERFEKESAAGEVGDSC